MRGASNAVLCALEAGQLQPGGDWVVCHSSGNHGAAVAKAAKLCRVRCAVVVPTTTPAVKMAAIKEANPEAEVVQCEPTLAARLATVESVCALKAADGCRVVQVPPFDKAEVMAGQGTLALEMYEQAEELLQAEDEDGSPSSALLSSGLDAIIIPISGGGLISGCATAAVGLSRERGRQLRVFCAEPQGANRAALSFSRGEQVTLDAPDTICDALRVNRLGDRPWAQIRQPGLLEEVISVSDDEVRGAMRTIFHRMKQVVEPSGACATAALLSPRFVEVLKQQADISSVGVLVCGGNVDLDQLPVFLG